MKNKILILLICLIGIFGFIDIVSASEDHSLNYDVEKFEFKNGNIKIRGWAFIHNYNNYGGSNLKLYFYLKSGDKKIGFNDKGESVFNATFLNRDLTTVMCYKYANGSCVSGYYDYKNVGFEIDFSLENYLEQMGSNTWDLVVVAKLNNGQVREENLAVSTRTGVVDLDTNNGHFIVNGLGDKIDVTGNHVVFPSDSITYWKLAKGYSFEPDGGDSSGGIYQYKLYYKKGGNFSRNTMDSVCGFSYAGLASSGVCTDVCKKGTSGCNTAFIKSTFVKPSGSVKIKYKGEEVKFCSVQNSTISDCDDSANYSCSAMTVKTTDGISADVSVNEQAVLSQDDDYSTMTVPVGLGFKYGTTYSDTVVWTIVKRNYSDNSYDSKICSLLKSKYYNKINDLNNLVTISDNYNSNKSDENLGKAGSWISVKNEEGNCSITRTFKYVINSASYDIKNNIITYSSNIKNKVNGIFYTPIKMCVEENAKGTFSWKIKSSDNLASAKVRTSQNESSIERIQFQIETDNSNNSSCYINVKSSLYDECSSDGTGDVTSGTGSRLKYSPVYRTIDESEAFPKTNPDNWVAYAKEVGASNINSIPRITNIINYYKSSSAGDNSSAEYVTSVITKNLISDYLKNSAYNTSYSSWNDIDKDGKNNTIVSDGEYFKKIANKSTRCKIGEFSKECDQQ